MTDVTMPRLSDSMQEGTIVRWLKSSGDRVAPGDELAEIETDKAVMTYAADWEGTLEILAAEGESLEIGRVIARLTSGGSGGRPVRPDASPVARRMARELGVDVGALVGSGPRGRILKADVHTAALRARDATEPGPRPVAPRTPVAAESAPRPGATASAEDGARGTLTGVELSRLQQVVARRMSESKATAPDFTLHAEVDVAAATAWRAQLKQAAAGLARPAPSFNDLVIKAVALALRHHPRANGAYRDGRWELASRVNVGMAVAADHALVVPTIVDADRKSLGEIAREARELAAAVREGTIRPPQLAGATCTVTNLGMFGVAAVDPILNPPQAAIVGVGAIREVPVVADGALAVGERLHLSLVCDHRILYGADAAEFLIDIVRRLERPAGLAL